MRYSFSWLLIFAMCLISPLLSNAVVFVEEFNSPNLNKKVWDMKTQGKASYKIADSVLRMDSPAVESGAILYHPRNLQDEDITFEVKLDVSELGDNISLGFIADLLEPQINTEINKNLEATFYFVADRWYIKQDPVVIGEKPPNPPGMEGQYKKDGWRTVIIDYSKSNGKITFHIDGKKAGEVDRNKDVKKRYFYITCDPYTSHYTGGVSIDSITISGPGAAALAVDAERKLSVTWGRLKARY